MESNTVTGHKQYYLTNLLGQQIQLENTNSSKLSNEIILDVKNVPSGMYFLHTIDNEGESDSLGKVEVRR